MRRQAGTYAPRKARRGASGGVAVSVAPERRCVRCAARNASGGYGAGDLPVNAAAYAP